MPYYSDAELSALVDSLQERVRALEAQVMILSNKTGTPYEVAVDTVPADVVDLVKKGDRLGAMKRYRELTGAGADQALSVINKI